MDTITKKIKTLHYPPLIKGLIHEYFSAETKLIKVKDVNLMEHTPLRFPLHTYRYNRISYPMFLENKPLLWGVNPTHFYAMPTLGNNYALFSRNTKSTDSFGLYYSLNYCNMSLNFNKPLEEGKSYQACMDIANFFKIPPVMFDSLVKSPLINAATYAILANTMRLKIGLSMTDSTFGDSIGITPAVVDSLDWQNFCINFTANKAYKSISFAFDEATNEKIPVFGSLIQSSISYHQPFKRDICGLFPSLHCVYRYRFSYLFVDNISLRASCSATINHRDTISCVPLLLAVPQQQDVSYQWSNGSRSQWALADKSGRYAVTVTHKEGCIATDTINFTLLPSPQFSIAQADTTCITDTAKQLQLEIVPNNFVNMLWLPSQTTGHLLQTRSLAQQTVQVTANNGCTTTQKFTPVDGCRLQVLIPNAFSPNADGLNEVFGITGQGIAQIEIFIYNRWGELVFTQKAAEIAWNGKLKNKTLPQGIYKAIIYIKGKSNAFTGVAETLNLSRDILLLE